MRRNLTRREWLTAAGSASLLGFAGMAQADSHTLSDVPVVESADRPTMGTDSSNPTATVYGNFKCPVTQGFVNGNLRTIVEEFVREGQLNIEFANLAYNPGTTSYYISSSDPRLAAFGRALWDQQPGSYWSFFEEMFDTRVSGYLEYGDIADEASARGVSSAGSVASSASGYEPVADSVADSAASDGVSWIPTLVLAGDATAPHHGTQGILNFIDARVDDAPSGTTEEPSDDSGSDDSGSDDSGSDDSGSDDSSSDDSGSEEETTEDTSDDSDSDDSESESESETESQDDEPEESENESSDDTSTDDSGSSESDGESSDDSDDESAETQVESTSNTEEEEEDDGGSCIIRDGILG